MNNKHLCWSCQNCTSINKCEFVKKINEFYEEQRKQFAITKKILNGEHIYFTYEPIKDLSKFYIKGTETDKRHNIIKCPCYLKEKTTRPETRREYLEQISSETKESISNLNDKERILSKHFERIKKENIKDIEIKQDKANEHLQNILLNRKIIELYKKGYFSFKEKKELLNMENVKQKQARLQELEANYLQSIQNVKNVTNTKQTKENNKLITIAKIRTNNLLSKQEKELLCNIKNREERHKKFCEMIDIKNRENNFDDELFSFKLSYWRFDFTIMTDLELINYIKQLNFIYVKNQFGKNLTDCEIKATLNDFKRIICNESLKFYLHDILIELNFDNRKKEEQYYIQLETKRIQHKRKISELSKSSWEKRKQKKLLK